jgi:glycosyltransferase involved in cell wall biosynthesis
VLITRLLGRDKGGAVDDAVRELSVFDWTGTSKPALLGYAPVARGNPYQQLVYDRLPDAGIRPVAVYDNETALELTRLIGRDVDVVTHLHWLSVATQGAESESAARRQADEYLDQLEQLVDAGGRLLWTVHNVLPHDSEYTDVDVHVRRRVADLAHRIHVMSPRTRELCAPYFDIPPEKVFSVAHPSYHGAYPDHISQLTARQMLGISPGPVVHVMLGAIKAYKGLPELQDAFDELTRREPGRHVLLVAGNPDGSEEAESFQRWALRHGSVLADLRKIPVEDVQVFMRAADIAVLPYRRSLNSGALALSCTFGLPAVLPSSSGESDDALDGFTVTYDADEQDGLVDAMQSAATLLTTDTARAASEAFSASHHRDLVARQFADAVRTWLDAPR